MADQDDDDFGFDDDDLDDLPANALEHLEANALRATQQSRPQPPPHPVQESDYGLDDSEEVVNLNDASGLPRASPWVVTVPVSHHTQPQREDTHDYDYDYQQNGDNDGYNDKKNNYAAVGPDDYDQGGAGAHSQTLHQHFVNVQELPQPSQADPNQLLQRIKKVRCPRCIIRASSPC